MKDDSTPPIEPGAIIDRFYDALARGDLLDARDCCAPDVTFWHSFDRLVLNLDEASRGWAELFATFPERAFVDVRRSIMGDGQDNRYVQQLLMVVTAATGDRLGWPLCIIVTIRDGLIARLDEYIDRAGNFVVTADDLRTLGLA